jgi:hypothetical protein
MLPTVVTGFNANNRPDIPMVPLPQNIQNNSFLVINLSSRLNAPIQPTLRERMPYI